MLNTQYKDVMMTFVLS